MTGAYWPAPWTGEDGGPRRWGCATGQPGLGIQPGERLEVAAVHDAFATDLLVRRGPGELYALRHGIPVRGAVQGAAVEGWVERLDAGTLAVTAASPRLPAGAWWPGGIAAHANGSLHMVLGRWAHRLGPELDVLASHRLPAERPHNSFVVLDGGELVTKDCDAPAGREPSTVSVLDPGTLLPVAEPLRLPEPSIARLSSDGERVIAVGTETVFRLRLDRGAGRVLVDDWRPRYGPAPERGYGWDPVVTEEHVLWMDNGRNRTDRTMLGSGEQADPVRLWWARHDDDTARSAEISGLPYGTESNPPAWDPVRRVVVAYDAGNAVLRAWRMEGDELEPRWRLDGFAHAGHLIVYPDTRELVAQDFHVSPAVQHPLVRGALRPLQPLLARSATARRASLRTGQDHLVVLDLDSGAEKARVAVPSPSQGFLFPAPGFGRDVYYQSLLAVVRVAVV